MKFNFILISAEDCPACRSFKSRNSLDELSNTLSSNPNISNVMILNFPSLSTWKNHFKDLPDQLKKYINYFPSFFLIEEESWLKCYEDKKAELLISIYGMVYTNGTLATLSNANKYPYTNDGIISWVNTKINEYNIIINNNITIDDNNNYDRMIISKKKRKKHNYIN